MQRLASSSKSSDKIMACRLKTVGPIRKRKGGYLVRMVLMLHENENG